MAVKQRHMQADYLNVSTGGEPEFVLMGAGFKTLDETPAAPDISMTNQPANLSMGMTGLPLLILTRLRMRRR